MTERCLCLSDAPTSKRVDVVGSIVTLTDGLDALTRIRIKDGLYPARSLLKAHPWPRPVVAALGHRWDPRRQAPSRGIVERATPTRRLGETR